MNFLKILFWIVFTAVVVVFSINNWSQVTINLWGGLQADVKLPVLMLFFFIVGFVPALIYYRTKNWRLNRRLDTVERELSDARGIKQFRAPERSVTQTQTPDLTTETPTTPAEQETSTPGKTQTPGTPE